MRISDWSSDVCSSDLVARYGADVDWKSPAMTAYLDELADRHIAIDTTIAGYEDIYRCVPGRTFATQRFWVGRILMEAEGSRSEEHTSELQSLMRISYAVFFLTQKKTHRGLSHACITKTSNINKYKL